MYELFDFVNIEEAAKSHAEQLIAKKDTGSDIWWN